MAQAAVQVSEPVVARQRPRPRRLDVTSNVPAVAEVPEEILNLARDLIRANGAANKAAKVSRDAKAALFSKMVQTGHRAPFHVVSGEDVWDIAIEQPDKDVINTEELKKLVTDEVFMRIIKATKGDVKKHAGATVQIAVTKTEKGDEALSCEKRKS